MLQSPKYLDRKSKMHWNKKISYANMYWFSLSNILLKMEKWCVRKYWLSTLIFWQQKEVMWFFSWVKSDILESPSVSYPSPYIKYVYPLKYCNIIPFYPRARLGAGLVSWIYQDRQSFLKYVNFTLTNVKLHQVTIVNESYSHKRKFLI